MRTTQEHRSPERITQLRALAIDQMASGDSQLAIDRLEMILTLSDENPEFRKQNESFLYDLLRAGQGSLERSRESLRKELLSIPNQLKKLGVCLPEDTPELFIYLCELAIDVDRMLGDAVRIAGLNRFVHSCAGRTDREIHDEAQQQLSLFSEVSVLGRESSCHAFPESKR